MSGSFAIVPFVRHAYAQTGLAAPGDTTLWELWAGAPSCTRAAFASLGSTAAVLRCANGNSFTSYSPVFDAGWTQVATTYDLPSNQVVVYGMPVPELRFTCGTLPAGMATLVVGRGACAGTGWVGSMFDAQFYDAALPGDVVMLTAS